MHEGLGKHDGRVVRGKRAKRGEPESGERLRGDARLWGARRAAMSAITKQVARSSDGLRQHHGARRNSRKT